MNRQKLSIIIPIYNESKIINQQVKILINELKKKSIIKYELILVENGSTDNSWSKISALKKCNHQIKTLQLPFKSYGQAIKNGILVSNGQLLVLFNLDFYSVDFLTKALKLFPTVDIVIGSKTLTASQDQRPIVRRLTTYFFNSFLKLTLNYPGSDTHGIKVIKNNQKLLSTTIKVLAKHELFDTELLIRLTRSGSNLTELPIKVKEIRPTRYQLNDRLWRTFTDFCTIFYSKYIVNNALDTQITVADDHGYSSSISKIIINSAQSSQINLISILPNYVSKKDLKTIKTTTQKFKSIHINLIEGKPISSNRTIYSIVDKKGKFYSLPIFLTRLLLKKIQTKHLEIEINNQIRKIKSLGLNSTHFTSHQNIHIFPPLWNLCLKICQENHFTAIRSQKSIEHRLKNHPLKFIVYKTIFPLLTLNYGKNKSVPKQIKNSHESIIHPGTNYD